MHNRYGEVYWTMMDPVPLKKQLVERFKDQTMAVVGYETDQVFYSYISISCQKPLRRITGYRCHTFKVELFASLGDQNTEW